MTKLLFAIFAHPDDEAFGPSGVLLQEVESGAEVHLITLTLGGAGQNPDGYDDLEAVREKEWRAGGELIGALSMTPLGFHDGQLSNTAMIEAAERIQERVVEAAANRSDIEIEFMTTDLNGITGHIDHIVAGRAACLAFYRLRENHPELGMTRIRLVCIPRAQLPESNIDWLYMEPGRTETEIDETIDARNRRDQIIEIMRCHHTQRQDAEGHISRRGDELGMSYFRILQ